jgi:hypothetical protein
MNLLIAIVLFIAIVVSTLFWVLGLANGYRNAEQDYNFDHAYFEKQIARDTSLGYLK